MMNRKYRTSSSPTRPTRDRKIGMTLIEVIAGLAILGTLAAMLAISRGRSLRQWREADERLAATRAVDALLDQWLSGPPRAIPINSQGAIQGAENCVWRTSLSPNPVPAQLDSRVLRVDVVRRDAARASPILSVEVLVHNPPHSSRRSP